MADAGVPWDDRSGSRGEPVVQQVLALTEAAGLAFARTRQSSAHKKPPSNMLLGGLVNMRQSYSSSSSPSSSSSKSGKSQPRHLPSTNISML